MNQNSIYCIFCESSEESKVEAFLKGLGFNVISALAERNVFKNGKWIKEFRSIIPGYVFFENNCEPDWEKISENKHIYYPLQYLDKSKKLRENDLVFVKWLKKYNGKIKISKAIENGNKIEIIKGPLMGMDKKMVKINKRQKCMGIKMEGEGLNNIIWLSYEM